MTVERTIYRNNFDLCNWRMVKDNGDGTGQFAQEPDPFAGQEISPLKPIEYRFALSEMRPWRL